MSVALVCLVLKCAAAFWSLLVWAVAASFISKSNSYFGSGAVNNSNFAAGNALIAAGLLSMFYYGAVIFFMFTRSDHILISVMVDTIFNGFFFIFYLAATAALSTEASFFSRWDHSDTWASLGNAVVGLGWVMTFLVLGILLFEVIYTLKHYGGTYSTWRTPLCELDSYGTSPSAGVATGAGGAAQPHQASSAVPMSTVSGTSQASTLNTNTSSNANYERPYQSIESIRQNPKLQAFQSPSPSPTFNQNPHVTARSPPPQLSNPLPIQVQYEAYSQPAAQYSSKSDSHALSPTPNLPHHLAPGAFDIPAHLSPFQDPAPDSQQLHQHPHRQRHQQAPPFDQRSYGYDYEKQASTTPHHILPSGNAF
ncbi:hypothetical protein I316_00888 [Kwoniella heveanensis BCC8398]|uniref:MARVEL domain-containing protein n=1 Tax=Kwoniella heveanensis BCC8398 TaxID=1296120 RepID=A0A1B9H3B2_9TREE|nr:hypothetical protein I316_00888 [Kwoniella heveanensis BCC8398]